MVNIDPPLILYSSNNNLISGLEMQGPGAGIKLSSSNNNMIIDNDIYGSNFNIRLKNSNDNQLINNIVASGLHYGLVMISSHNNKIEGNVIDSSVLSHLLEFSTPDVKTFTSVILVSSDYNILNYNDIRYNPNPEQGYSIMLLSSSYNSLCGNILTEEVIYRDSGSFRNSFCGSRDEIPEFPTIVIPIAAILGLAFIFQRRRDEE